MRSHKTRSTRDRSIPRSLQRWVSTNPRSHSWRFFILWDTRTATSAVYLHADIPIQHSGRNTWFHNIPGATINSTASSLSGTTYTLYLCICCDMLFVVSRSSSVKVTGTHEVYCLLLSHWLIATTECRPWSQESCYWYLVWYTRYLVPCTKSCINT